MAEQLNRKGVNMFRRSNLKFLILFAALLSCVWGCATPKARPGHRFLWPPLPATPRIEWIGSYGNYTDFNRYRQSFWTRMAGGEAAITIRRPWGIAASQDGGKVYVGDTQRTQVLVFDMAKETVHVMGAGRYANLFSILMGVAVDSSGNIYTSDSQKNQIYVFTKDEKPLLNIGDETLLSWPIGIAVDDKRNRLYVANNHNHNIAVFDLSGKHLFNIGRRGSMPGYFNFPTDVDVDSKGNIVVADSMNARVQFFSPDGQYIKHFGKRGDGVSDFEIIKGVAVDRATDNVYVTDGKGNDFKIFSSDGEPLLTVGGRHSVKRKRDEAPGGFLLPQDIEIDNKGRVYIVDSLNRRFQVFKIIDDEWLNKKPL